MRPAGQPGLLAGRSDMELLARTGVGRDVNRHRYTIAEIDADLAGPVVQALGRRSASGTAIRHSGAS